MVKFIHPFNVFTHFPIVPTKHFISFIKNLDTNNETKKNNIKIYKWKCICMLATLGQNSHYVPLNLVILNPFLDSYLFQNVCD